MKISIWHFWSQKDSETVSSTWSFLWNRLFCASFHGLADGYQKAWDRLLRNWVADQRKSMFPHSTQLGKMGRSVYLMTHHRLSNSLKWAFMHSYSSSLMKGTWIIASLQKFKPNFVINILDFLFLPFHMTFSCVLAHLLSLSQCNPLWLFQLLNYTFSGTISFGKTQHFQATVISRL